MFPLIDFSEKELQTRLKFLKFLEFHVFRPQIDLWLSKFGNGRIGAGLDDVSGSLRKSSFEISGSQPPLMAVDS